MFKRYKMKLKLLGPLHIGNGAQRGTKEYIFSEEGRRVFFINQGKLIENIESAGKLTAFQSYIETENSEVHLLQWLQQNGVSMTGLASGPIPYVSDEPKPTAIDEFIKNCNCDYLIPGSSTKGMLRTIIERKFLEFGKPSSYDQFTFWNKLSVSDSSVIPRENAIICGKKFKEGPVFLECLRRGVETEIEIVVKSAEIEQLLPKDSKELADGMPFNLGKGGGNQSKSLKIREDSWDESAQKSIVGNVDKLPKSVEIDGNIYKFGDVVWTIEEIS